MADILGALGALAPAPGGGLALVSAALETFGGRSGFAAAIAGTDDKRSKEYKAALKSVERWDRYAAGERGKDVRNPERMRGGTREKIADAIEREATKNGAEFNVRGTVTISKDTRKRDFSVELTGEEIRGMLTQARQAEALGENPIQAAMNVITGAYLGSDARYAGGALPYSERMEYGADVDVDVTPL